MKKEKQQIKPDIKEIKTSKNENSASNGESKLVKSKLLRLLIFIVGLISFVLGTIGTVLPVLPTVPFYLLAAFCFVRSNERFNNWFLHSKLYKKHLENFATTRAMILVNEIILLVSVSAMLMCTIYFVDKLAVTIILTILIACKYSYFIFRVKPINKKEFLLMQAARAQAQEERDVKELEEITEIKDDASTIVEDNKENVLNKDSVKEETLEGKDNA